MWTCLCIKIDILLLVISFLSNTITNRNSIPPTTTKENFVEKFTAASDNVFVDVAFWGGIIPGNQVILNPTNFQIQFLAKESFPG